MLFLTSCSQSGGDASEFIPGECTQETATAAREVIENQISAFGDGDFERARTFSSRRFRFNVTAEYFEKIMSADYGFLLENPDLGFLSCDIPDSSQVAMTVQAPNAPTLVYTLVNEDGNWRIDVAGYVSDPSDGDTAEAEA